MIYRSAGYCRLYCHERRRVKWEEKCQGSPFKQNLNLKSLGLFCSEEHVPFGVNSGFKC